MKNLFRSILITVFATNLMMLLYSLHMPDAYWTSGTIVSQFVNAVILGVIVAFANLLFSMHWPFIVVLGLHYLITMTAVFIINFDLLGSLQSGFSLYAHASVIYFIIWLYYYIDEKRAIQKMNKQLQQRGE